jgi:hypothetical protein
VSATVVQGIKSGKRKNIEYTTLKARTHALGYQFKFKKMNKATHSSRPGARAYFAAFRASLFGNGGVVPLG